MTMTQSDIDEAAKIAKSRRRLQAIVDENRMAESVSIALVDLKRVLKETP